MALMVGLLLVQIVTVWASSRRGIALPGRTQGRRAAPALVKQVTEGE